MNKTLQFILCCFLTTSSFAQTQIFCGLGDIAGSGSSSSRYAIESHNDVVYATGVSFLFRNIGNAEWESIQPTSGAQVMKSIDDYLYIGLNGGVSRFDDQDESFEDVGQALNNGVKAIAVYNDELVAGGNMSSDINGVPVNLIAHLDGGTTWKTLGEGFNTVQPGFPLEVNDMIVYNGSLIATGRFKFSGTTEVNGIAQWDGTSWQPFGTGLFSVTQPGGYGFGRSLAVYDDKLVVAGFFSSVDGVQIAGNIAIYDGTEWSSLGDLPNNNNVTSLEVVNGVLYAGGIKVLTDTGESPLAAWDGTQWVTVVEFSDPGPIIWGLGSNETDNELYFCGNILEIYDESTNSFQNFGNVASLACDDPISSVIENDLSSQIDLYPNPVRSILNISLLDFDTNSLQMEILNVVGERITTFSQSDINNSIVQWDTRTISSGMYFLKITSNYGLTFTKKIIKN